MPSSTLPSQTPTPFIHALPNFWCYLIPTPPPYFKSKIACSALYADFIIFQIAALLSKILLNLGPTILSVIIQQGQFILAILKILFYLTLICVEEQPSECNSLGNSAYFFRISNYQIDGKDDIQNICFWFFLLLAIFRFLNSFLINWYNRHFK